MHACVGQMGGERRAGERAMWEVGWQGDWLVGVVGGVMRAVGGGGGVDLDERVHTCTSV